MVEQTVLNRCFSEALGVDFERVAPGEIRVVRSLQREKALQRPEGVTLMTPVWILVANGRGIVATSRFLQRIVTDWAESFAAPEHLLNPLFQQDLLEAVERAQDGAVTAVRHRIFIPNALDEKVPRLVGSHKMQDFFSELWGELAAVAPAVFCGDTDWPEAHRILAEGGTEYGRLVRFMVIR
jgi:hypothetical protein